MPKKWMIFLESLTHAFLGFVQRIKNIMDIWDYSAGFIVKLCLNDLDIILLSLSTTSM